MMRVHDLCVADDLRVTEAPSLIELAALRALEAAALRVGEDEALRQEKRLQANAGRLAGALGTYYASPVGAAGKVFVNGTIPTADATGLQRYLKQTLPEGITITKVYDLAERVIPARVLGAPTP